MMILVPGPVPCRTLGDVVPSLLDEVVEVIGRDVDPAALGSGSNLKVRWRCGACGHQWVAAVSARAGRGTGCPTCTRKVRARSRAQAPEGLSLADLHPGIAEQFVANVERADMTPADLRASSHQRCIWTCGRCAQECQATVANRVKGLGCPSCRASVPQARPSARPDGATAASAAPALVAKLVENLTRPGDGLEVVRPGAVDRCRWRCACCSHQWEATVVNRVSKASGCLQCGIARNSASRRVPRPGQSLAELFPEVTAQFVANLDIPGRSPAEMAAGVNDSCRWRCARGHQWVTSVAARTVGSGCARCRGNGRSLFEHQVATMIAAATSSVVRVDVRQGGRTWRVDLEVVDAHLLVDLDPVFWHRNAAGRDQRKCQAMRGREYVRVRPHGLPTLDAPTVTVARECESPYLWAAALEPVLSARGLTWRSLDAEKQGAALVEAVRVWRAETARPPVPSALDVNPALAEEFVANTTSEGVGLDWLSPNAKDQCSWRCVMCGHEWTTSVASRAGQGSACPRFSQRRLHEAIRARSLPAPGQSLADVAPAVAAEFVACVSQPARTPETLRPASNLMCWWRCAACGTEFCAIPAARTRGRGCGVCGGERTRRARMTAPPGGSLEDLHPALAEELVGCVPDPDLSSGQLLPGSNKACRWCCSVCAHTWTAAVATRTTGGGCPACGHRRTASARATAPAGGALGDLFPDLAAEFVANLDSPTRLPTTLKTASHARCRWRCATCSGVWITSVKNRTRNGTGCPHCYRTRAAQTGRASGCVPRGSGHAPPTCRVVARGPSNTGLVLDRVDAHVGQQRRCGVEHQIPPRLTAHRLHPLVRFGGRGARLRS